jgi:hypothetical protein
MLPKMRKAALTGGNSGTLDGESGSTPLHQPFSQSQFLKSLVNFIVSDDQVRTTLCEHSTVNHIILQSINIMECHEFRDLLLLLREDLEEKDIPHHTKLHEAIITAWQMWFVGLKQDLAVCVTN